MTSSRIVRSRAAPSCTASPGRPRPRTACCKTTWIRRSPNGRRTWWSTAGAARPHATGQPRRHPPLPGKARVRRDAAHSVRQAGGRVPHPHGCPAGADRQLEPGAPLGNAAALRQPGSARLDHVRQMTAGSWIYIGNQGILQGTYETLGRLARQRGWPSLRGKFVLTAGLGGMGGATATGDHDERRRRAWSSRSTRSAPNAAWRPAMSTRSSIRSRRRMTLVEQAVDAAQPLSIGLIGNAAEIYRSLCSAASSRRRQPIRRGSRCADVRPAGTERGGAEALRREQPETYEAALAGNRWRANVQAMLAFRERAPSLRLRQQPAPAAFDNG